MKQYKVYEDNKLIGVFYWNPEEESFFSKLEETLYILQELTFPSYDRKKLHNAIQYHHAIFDYHNTEFIDVTWNTEKVWLKVV